MKYVSRKIANGGLLVGHMVSDAGGKFEVRHDPSVGYTMHYKGSILHGATIEDLEDAFKKIDGWKRDWIDVIIVSLDSKMTQSCPPTMQGSLAWSPKHIAQLPDGSWVSAHWNPEATFRPEVKEPDFPREIVFPQLITPAYCGSKTQRTILLPYSEMLIARLKQFQLQQIDAVQSFADGLLLPPKSNAVPPCED